MFCGPRNDLLEKQLTVFVFSFYSIFNCDISHWFSYVASVKTASSLWLFLITFTKYPTRFGLKIWKWQDKKTKKRCQDNIPHSLAKGKLQGKNEKKFSNHLGDACRLSCTSQFTKAAAHKYSTENFRKFLETHPW